MERACLLAKPSVFRNKRHPTMLATLVRKNESHEQGSDCSKPYGGREGGQEEGREDGGMEHHVVSSPFVAVRVRMQSRASLAKGKGWNGETWCFKSRMT